MLGLGRMVDQDGNFLGDTRKYSRNPGTNYSQPLLACVSATRASVKTVKFRLNGTAAIRNLAIDSVLDVGYSSEAKWPTWAMEETGQNISAFDPFWGLVPDDARDLEGLDIVKRPDFYLPAGVSSYFASSGIATGSSYSAAGADAPFKAFGEVYSGSGGSGKPSTGEDYSGADNWFLYIKWMNLSKHSETTGRIVDYIWTDLMANAVVGSTSILEPPNTNVTMPTVTQYYSGVGYDWRYAIPAFVMVVLYSSLLMLCIFMLAQRRLRVDELRHMLNQTSAGRAMTTERYKASDKADLAPTKEWVKLRGDELVLVGKADIRMDATSDKPSSGNYSDGERPEADSNSSEMHPLNVNRGASNRLMIT